MLLRKDLLTGEEFYGRVNQNFKQPSNRILYYNNRANQIRHSKRDIDLRLHRNFLLLNELLGKSKSGSYHKEYLLGKGFSFSNFTHVEKYENQNYYAIYNFVMIPLGETEVKFVRL